jgi:hypothetical protein
MVSETLKNGGCLLRRLSKARLETAWSAGSSKRSRGRQSYIWLPMMRMKIHQHFTY